MSKSKITLWALWLTAGLLVVVQLAPAAHFIPYFMEEQRFLSELGYKNSPAWSPDGLRIAVCSNEDIVILNSTDGLVLERFTPPSEGVGGVCWSPDGKRLASIGSEKAVRIWNASDNTEVLKLNVTDGYPSSVAWSPDGTRIAARVGERAISIFDADNGSRLLAIPLEQSIAGKGGLRWSPDGSELLDVGINHVFLFNATNGTMMTDISARTDVSSADWSPDNDRIAVSIHDEALAIYDAASGNRQNPPAGNSTVPVIESALAWSPDGESIATLGREGKLRFWDQDGKQVQTLDIPPCEYGAGLAWSPDSRWLAGAYGGEIRIWGLDGPSIEASVDARPDVMTSGEATNLTIHVKYANGDPVYGAEITFFGKDLGSYSPVTHTVNETYHATFTPHYMPQNLTDQEIVVMMRKEGVGCVATSFLISINGRPAPPSTNSPPVFLNISAANGSSFVSSRPVNISAKVYDADGDDLTVVWYVNGTKTTSHDYSAFLGIGNYTVRVLVTDDRATVETNISISVVEEPPSPGGNNTTQPPHFPNSAPVISNSTLLEGMKVKTATVYLSVSSSDQDGDNLTYRWTVDGTVIGTGRDLSHKFSPGDHSVTIEVSDGQNATTQSYNITVEKKADSPAPATIPGIGLAGAVCAVGIVVVLRKRKRHGLTRG